MTRHVFGRVADEGDIEEVVISAGELTVHVITLGAVIRDVRMAGIDHPLVLGFDQVENYVAHSPYFGAIAGRCANRIGEGRFVIDGVPYQVSLNLDDRNHLHGGFKGFKNRAWTITDLQDDSVELTLVSPDGEEGYPGEVTAICRYTVEPPGTLRMDARATTTAPTIVNLAQHSYFNLDGSDTILDHRVQIFADRITATDEDSIPTGELEAVAGTSHDFLAARPIRRANGSGPTPYDKNFVIATEKSETVRPVAVLSSPVSGISLAVASTEPGVQFYTGHFMDIPVPGLDGRRYGPFAGCCFEPQHYPDAINHPGFPSPLLRPDEVYLQTSTFGFSRS